MAISVDQGRDLQLNINKSFRFQPISLDDSVRIISSTKITYCPVDPINLTKLPSVLSSITPLILNIINKCFLHGVFPSSEKHACVRPLLKKKNLDPDNYANFRPISNLSFLSKLIERAMLDQLTIFLESNSVISTFQSAYRVYHSTETALCRVHNDLVLNVCAGVSSLLVLLDLSSAFDTIDHTILLKRFSSLGLSGKSFSLLENYLLNRSQSVVIGDVMSQNKPLLYGVPQGSILGPILFSVYMSPLSNIILKHGAQFHCYADDTQIYIPIHTLSESKSKIGHLLHDVKAWMHDNKLKLNDKKTEILVIRGNLITNLSPQFGNLLFDDSQLTPVSLVRNLGVMFDENISFAKHINSIVSKCHYHLRNLYMIRPNIDHASLLSLVNSLIVSQLDYCNILFYNIPKKQLRKLQTVLNRAARLLCYLPPRADAIPALIKLHWLPIIARIEYKMCLQTYKVLKTTRPAYLFELISPYQPNTDINLRSLNLPFRLKEPSAIRQKTFAERSFYYTAPRLFNKLPTQTKLSESTDSFKSNLKTYLFHAAYDLTNLSLTEHYTI